MDAWEAGWWGLTHPTEGIKVCDPSGTNCSDTMSAAEAATNPGKAAGQIAGNWADEQVMKFVESFYSGALNMFQSFITDFLHIGPVVDIAHDETLSYMKIATGPFVWFALVLGIILPCMRYFWTQRAEHLKDIWPGLLRVSAISTGGGVAVGIALAASDAAAEWFLQIVEWKPEDVVGLFKVGTASGGLLFAGMMIIGVIMILVMIIQYAIMMIKAIMVPILVVFWPASEAMNMAAGELRMSRTARWLLALIIYKPVLAVMFAFAFKLLIDGVNEQDPIKIVGKLMQAEGVLMLSVFALPAILKIIMPQASAAGPSGGGAELIQMVKLAATVAAMAVTGGAAGGAAGAGAGEAGAAGGGSGPAAGLAGGSGGGGDVGPSLAESGQMPGGIGSGSSSSTGKYVGGSSDSNQPQTGPSLNDGAESDSGIEGSDGQDDGVNEVSQPQPLGNLDSVGGSSDSNQPQTGPSLNDNVGSGGAGSSSGPQYGAGTSSASSSQPSFEGQSGHERWPKSSSDRGIGSFADTAWRYSQIANLIPTPDVESHIVDETHLGRHDY